MTTTFTNRAKYLLVTGQLVPGTADVRMGLLTTMAGLTNVRTINTVAEMEAHPDFAELTTAAVSNYARVTIPTMSATEDDLNNRARILGGTVNFGSLVTGGTIVGYFTYLHSASGDSVSQVLSISDLPSIVTNGTALVVNVSTNGYANLT